MKYVAPIGLIIIAIYNLVGDNNILFWRFMYFFPLNVMLLFAFIELSKKEPTGVVRNVYRVGIAFSGFYTLFQMLTLFSKDITAYLTKVNSVLWSCVSAGIIVLLIIYTLYDQAK